MTTKEEMLPELTKQQRQERLRQQRVAKSLEPEFLQCRLLGHQWDVAPNGRTPPFGDMITLRCGRCGSVREDIVSRRFGELLARRYDYADGYTIKPPKNGGRNFSAAALRAELNRRLLDDILKPATE